METDSTQSASPERLNPLNDFAFQDKMDMIARDPAMLRTYEGYEKALSDWTSGINGAKREGMLAGSRNKSLEIAKSLKTSGMSNPEISRHTGLSIEEIQRL